MDAVIVPHGRRLRGKEVVLPAEGILAGGGDGQCNAILEHAHARVECGAKGKPGLFRVGRRLCRGRGRKCVCGWGCSGSVGGEELLGRGGECVEAPGGEPVWVGAAGGGAGESGVGELVDIADGVDEALGDIDEEGVACVEAALVGEEGVLGPWEEDEADGLVGAQAPLGADAALDGWVGGELGVEEVCGDGVQDEGAVRGGGVVAFVDIVGAGEPEGV